MKYSDCSIVVALALSLVIQAAGLASAKTPDAGKQASLPQAQGYDKLNSGSGPDTNDLKGDTESGGAPSQLVPDISDSKLLDPVTLKTEDKTSGSGIFKSTVTATGFVPKGPLEHDHALTNPISIKAKKLNTMSDRASQVNVMPLPLQGTQQEADEKQDLELTADRRQLADLWEATLSRSNDIQFVIQRLMPSSDHAHTASIICKMLSTAVFTTCVFGPNTGGSVFPNAAGSLINSAIGNLDSSIAKKARISETESIMLYTLVRGKADKLVADFNDYKKNLEILSRKNQKLVVLQNMVAATRDSQPVSEQIKLDVLLSGFEDDIYGVSRDVRRYRQALVDAAGAEAVQKLDQQIDEEAIALNGAPTPAL